MNADQFQTELHNSLANLGAALVAGGILTATKETIYLNIAVAVIGLGVVILSKVQAYQANTVQQVAISAAVNAAVPAHPTTAQVIPLVIPATAPVAPSPAPVPPAAATVTFSPPLPMAPLNS